MSAAIWSKGWRGPVVLSPLGNPLVSVSRDMARWGRVIE